ncbi:MAG: inorganic phosphate transporter [Candidatus Methanomethylicus sp.]|nr:inorganic phosphate transporter [Candidatus Methanomethylicus sp.]
MSIDIILLIIGLVLAFIMAVNIGGNDAANPTSPTVGSGALSLKKTLAIFAIFTVAGATLQGYMVMKTIGSGIVENIDIIGAIAIVLAASIWIFFSSLRGMAISTGHSIISAVIGYGILKFTFSGLNFSILVSIVLSWITSPLCALFFGYAFFKIIEVFILKKQNGNKKIEKGLKIALIISLCFAAYSFGANDVSHATGVYIKITGIEGAIPNMSTMFFLALYGAIGIVIGGITIGRRVIETLAFKVTRLDIPTALAASLSNAFVVFAFATIPYLIWGYGLPISSSYAAVGAIIGASSARSKKSVNIKVSATLVLYWITTVPICAALGGVIYYLFTVFL